MQKGIGGITRGPLIETEARRLRDEAIIENSRKIALRLLKMNKLTIEEIAVGSGLSVQEIEQLKNQLAEPQTV